MGRHKIVFVIPARNEEKTILGIINKLKKISDVIVVDDASKDNTLKIIKDSGIKIIRNSENLGYQKSILNGIAYAKQKNYDYVITYDADGQHSNLNHQQLFNEINNGYDLIITQRNKYNRFLEMVFRYYSKFFFNDVDLFSGVKAYKLKSIKNEYLEFKYNSYGAELSVKIINNRLSFKKIPISILDRKDNSKVGNNFIMNIKLFAILIYFFIKYNLLLKKK